MATTREELESFHEYAARRLDESEFELSLDELLMEWADRRDRATVSEAIGRGLADVDAGRHESAEQALEKLEREFGFPRE